MNLNRFLGGFAKRFLTLLRWFVILNAGYILVITLLTAMYAFIPPPVTGIQVFRTLFDRIPAKPTEFLPLQNITKGTQNAFIFLEDREFYKHWGISLGALREAWDINKKLGRVVAGGSTITMQLSKNLFLWPDRSWVRKYFEVWGVLVLEGLLSKERILEIYLNTIEFGPGVYGLQAAARYHYRKDYSELTLNQIFRLAALITSPLRFNVRTMVNSRSQMARLRALGGS